MLITAYISILFCWSVTSFIKGKQQSGLYCHLWASAPTTLQYVSTHVDNVGWKVSCLWDRAIPWNYSNFSAGHSVIDSYVEFYCWWRDVIADVFVFCKLMFPILCASYNNIKKHNRELKIFLTWVGALIPISFTEAQLNMYVLPRRKSRSKWLQQIEGSCQVMKKISQWKGSEQNMQLLSLARLKD